MYICTPYIGLLIVILKMLTTKEINYILFNEAPLKFNM